MHFKNTITLALALLIAQAVAGQTTGTHYINGNWYNGKDFTPGDWYVVDGVFTQKAPANVRETVDLKGKYAIPPLADAFSSSLAGNPSYEKQLEYYLDEGVFYVQILGNTREERQNLEKLAGGKSPDLSFANGGLTCTLGIPFLRYESSALNIRNPQVIAERYEQIKTNQTALGDGYWYLNSKKEVDANWSKIIEQKPDLLSIYLLDADKNGGKEGKGLTPEVAKHIVRKAKRAGLRVVAHVETAADVKLGLKIGVSGFANLPLKYWNGNQDLDKYSLEDSDLAKIAKKGLFICPLLSSVQNVGGGGKPGVVEQTGKILQSLIASNAQVVIGSDDPQRTIRAELNYWFQTGLLEPGSALKILCVNTPRAIFPNRKIGQIAEGYEASFLVLNDNPLNNLLKIRAIDMKIKSGKKL